jgi:hypothetical protein
MESSRDSSVWRSLAVTFGGGLALGAVGMKLTQTALRPAEAPPRPEPNTLTDRLSSMERRLEQMEQAPSAPSRAPAASQPAAPIDQKVLGSGDRGGGRAPARACRTDGSPPGRPGSPHGGESARPTGSPGSGTAPPGNGGPTDGAAAGVRQVRENFARRAGQTAVARNCRSSASSSWAWPDATERFATCEMRQEHRQGMSDRRREIEHSVEARIVTAAAAAAAARRRNNWLRSAPRSSRRNRN